MHLEHARGDLVDQADFLACRLRLLNRGDKLGLRYASKSLPTRGL
jgi:hypothetical protein